MFKKCLKKLYERRFLVVVLLLFFAVSYFVAVLTFSEKTTSSIWDGKIASSFEKGKGTSTNPYKINTGNELAYFFKLLNSEESSDYFNKYYELNNNIDMDGREFNFSSLSSFSGTFNGNGYTIFNFRINDYYLTDEDSTANFNLFNSLNNATFKNLNLKDVTFEANGIKFKSDEEEIKSTNSDEEDTSVTTLEEKKEEVKEEKVEETKEEKKEEVVENKTEDEIIEVEKEDNKEEEKKEETKEEEKKEEEVKEEEKKDDEVKEEEKKEEETPLEDEDDKKEEENKTDDVIIEEESKIEKVTISLIKNSESSNIKNININNINIVCDAEEKDVDSSLFILNDNGSNNITNVHIKGNSSLNNTKVLLNELDKKTTLKNIIYNKVGLDLVSGDYTKLEDIYGYKVENGVLSINLEKVAEEISIDNEFNWKYENGELRIVNKGFNTIQKKVKVREVVTSNIVEHADGIENNIVFNNDLVADHNYLKGLNYTEVKGRTLPAETSTGFYDDENLVKVELIYDGADINNSNLVGAVSPINNENANKFVFFKYYALERNSNGTLATDANGHNYIRIELMDNPFSKRPYVNGVEYGFNGWICNQSVDTSTNLCSNTRMHYTKANYTRYMDVSVDGESEIIIHLNASWFVANVLQVTSDINSTLTDEFDSMTMKSIVATTYTYENLTGYAYWIRSMYTMQSAGSVNRNTRMTTGQYYKTNINARTYNYVNNNNNCGSTTCYIYNAVKTNIVANSRYYYGSTVEYVTNYQPQKALTTTRLNAYDSNLMYIVADANGDVTGNSRVAHTNSHLGAGENAQGYYYKVDSPTTAMINTGEYYNANGELCTSASSCTTSYKLIQYNDSILNSNGHSISTIEVLNGNIVDLDRYYYLVTRDTNIFRYTSTTALTMNTTLNVNRPFTVTGTEVNGNTVLGVLSVSGNFTLQNDMVFENIKFTGVNTVNSTNFKAISNSPSNSVVANDKNLKMGRNLSNSANNENYLVCNTVYGHTSSTNNQVFRVIVETGHYIGYNGATSTQKKFNESVIMGSDYDRALHDNTKLTLKVGYIGATYNGSYEASTYSPFALFATFKSGYYGFTLSNGTRTATEPLETGIYVNGKQKKFADPVGAKVEGVVTNIILGGSGFTGTNSNNGVYIGFSEGTAKQIYGGSTNTAAGGNRMLNVTGGHVTGSVLGGSNSSDKSSGGDIYGTTIVYIGGNVEIGTDTVTTTGLVTSGCVFGAGGGMPNGTSGPVYDSHVIIAGGTIHDSVYGGGNYGGTGTTRNAACHTLIEISAGTIMNGVYGGSKSAGFGKSGYATNNHIYVNVSGGNIGYVYGGSDTSGIVYGHTHLNITGGTINDNVYGGGKGADTFVSRNVEVVIGAANVVGTPEIGGNVYGGSALGTVNNNQTSGSAQGNTHVTINNGVITGYVFGGGEGNNNTTPYVLGNITVDFEGGSAAKVFGGNDQSGSHTAQNKVNLNGGTIGEVYGGGNKSSVTTTNVTLDGASVTTNIFGGSNQSGSVTTANVDIKSGSVGTIYGGNNEGGSCGTTNVEVTGGSVGKIYGGGKLVGTTTTHVDVYNHTGTISHIFGGGTEAGATSTNIVLHSRNGSNNINVTNLFGGSDQSGTVNSSSITVGRGTVGTIYGGNNEGGSTLDSTISVTDGGITTIYGGGNYAENGATHVTISGGNVSDKVYGGGNQADVTSDTSVTISGGAVGVATYGGGKVGAVEGDTTVTISGGTNSSVFGGGDQAGVEGDTTVTVTGGTINTVIYGGGNEGTVDGTANVSISNTVNTVPNVFGGGNEAGAGATVVTLSNTAKVTDVYGGSNTSGVVTSTSITMNNGTVGSIYGGNNAGGTSGSTSVTVNNGTVTSIYGGGKDAQVTGSTLININNATNQITEIYGGGHRAGANSTTVNLNNVAGNNIRVTKVFGGSNTSGNVGTSNVVVNAGNVGTLYGGNNLGGVTTSANTTVNAGTIGTIYGGGKQATSGASTVTVTGGSATDIYGGGDAAGVTNNSSLTMTGGTATHNVYGGGHEGTVGGNTTVLINNATINGSAYAGGDGSTAVVNGNTSISVGGTTVVGTNACVVKSTCSVFGGGNAAATGRESVNNSTSTVNIAGATVYGNVYGGANTSKVFGSAHVNIGSDVTTNATLTSGNVSIKGTVFGGGEANASGSDEYDWTFVSVTQGITVNINGNNYNNFEILGSIFGSGNASTAAGTSTVTIKNYGTFASPQRNVSIQRTNLLTLDNSAIVLRGATDRENEFSDVLFTLSRINELDMKNNSTLFLETGANLLEDFKSMTSTGAKAQVLINENTKTITKNVDNRIYMYADKKLNIAKNQQVTDYGEVSGMTFFGMYKYNANGTVNTGIYNKHEYDDTLDWGGVFDNVSSYVLGLHKTNHDIEVDGFYTNYIDEETAKNIPNYIEPTPPTGPLYMWTIGEGVIEYEIDLSASKFSTLGTTELSLRDFTEPNTSFQVLGFDYSELEPGVQLVNKNTIKKIADTDNDANTKIGLSMESSNIGWLTNGYTQFISDPNADKPYIGTYEYVGGNNASAPTLLFYLNHSKNITEAGDLGTVRIMLNSVRQISALEKETKRLLITINMSRVLFDTINYEGAMTAGRKYDLFTSTATNITSHSSISTYFSLFYDGSSIYRNGYHRSLVSNYVLPLNTKITMIDLANDTPEYYYHIITSADVTRATNELSTNREIAYDLSMFEKMGALNSGVYYDDAAKNTAYSHNNQYCNEEFIFIIDFGDTEIQNNALNNQLLLEIRDGNNESIYSVLAPQHQNMIYNIYVNKDAIIDMDGTLDRYKIYNGESFVADMTIDYTQSMVGSTTILDTHYFDAKLGIKISLINSDGDVVTGTTLLGLYYEIDGVRYYPNIDGTTRIKVADKVDSAEKWVIVNTGTSKIASGIYTLRFESFGSSDGIYYGLESSDTKDFQIEIVNEIYGLDVNIPKEHMILDKTTGLNQNGTSEVRFITSYDSGLTNPSIHLKMYRRKYDHADDTDYELVDYQDYFDSLLMPGNSENEYILIESPTATNYSTLVTKPDLVSGTYKLEFILYDGNSAIGSIEKYIIIR